MSIINFSREKTQILKGIALIFMIIHHTSLPAFWAEPNTLEYSNFSFLVGATKMCVWIFAFLVGYGFYCSKNKSIQYSLKRILLLIVPFWFMMLVMFLPSAYASGYFDSVLSNNTLHIGG